MFHCELKNIQAHVIVGLFDFERTKEQPLYFDLSYKYTATNDVSKDQLAEAPDYVAVADALVSFCKNQKFQLLETLLDSSITQLHLQFPQIESITLSVRKPAAYPNGDGPKITLSKEF